MTNPNDSSHPVTHEGMLLSSGLTKREYFAALALQGFISTGQYKSAGDMAQEAVYAADALINELNCTEK